MPSYKSRKLVGVNAADLHFLKDAIDVETRASTVHSNNIERIRRMNEGKGSRQDDNMYTTSNKAEYKDWGVYVHSAADPKAQGFVYKGVQPSRSRTVDKHTRQSPQRHHRHRERESESRSRDRAKRDDRERDPGRSRSKSRERRRHSHKHSNSHSHSHKHSHSRSRSRSRSRKCRCRRSLRAGCSSTPSATPRTSRWAWMRAPDATARGS